MRDLDQRLYAAALAGALVAAPACGPRASKREPLRVAAASDLAFALPEIGAAFQKKTGAEVVFTFGSSGLLAKQIEEGAPYDVFASASQSYVDEVRDKHACEGESVVLGRGQLVAWTRAGAAPARLEDLADPAWKRIAIANPDHAPYGKAAVEALKSAGVYDAVRSRLVLGESVQQALQFAESGNADVSLVALALALRSGGAFAPLPLDRYAPIRQTAVLCNHARAVDHAALGRALFELVASDAGKEILGRYGFAP
ncbi:MAG TPA: molybdate ABC transporter substrate-binding protein [Byssovorax sp.]|jgi:molybdate transport system substrate-binding protein